MSSHTPLVQTIENFIHFIRYERALSSKTQENYQRQLTVIASMVGIEKWADLTVDHVRKVLSESKRAGLSATSINLRLSALRSFCQYLTHQGILVNNPAKQVSAPKLAKPLPKNLNVDEVSQLLEFSPEKDIEVRDRAMFELTYACGLRLAEIAELNIEHIQENRQILVKGKGNKERMLPVPKLGWQWLQAWLKARTLISDVEEHAVFLSIRGNRISHRQIAQRLKLWGKRQSLNQDVNPHKLRHSYATHMLESSQDLRAVQELLGHANLSTTQVYTHLDFQHLANVYDNTHPRAHKKK